MSRPFSNLAGWDYTAMTGHSNVDGKCSLTHARWWPLFFCFLFSPLGFYGFLTRTMSIWVSSFNRLHITLYPQIHPRVSVTMRRSKGLAESTEVYSVENHCFADDSSGSGTPQGPKRTSIDGCARDYCIARSSGLPWSLIYWELESRDWNPIPIPAHGHTFEKQTGHKWKKKEKKKKKVRTEERNKSPPPIEFLTRRRK